MHYQFAVGICFCPFDEIVAGLFWPCMFVKVFKDKVCILLGSEVETTEKGRNGKQGSAHNVCFFPYLKDIKAFSNEMSKHIKNITLSTQRSDVSGYELIDIVSVI